VAIVLIDHNQNIQVGFTITFEPSARSEKGHTPNSIGVLRPQARNVILESQALVSTEPEESLLGPESQLVFKKFRFLLRHDVPVMGRRSHIIVALGG